MNLDTAPLASTPVFGLLVRFWQFVEKVYVRRVPWLLADAAGDLEVCERTVRRYVEIAKTLLTDGDGHALIVLEVKQGRTYIVLRKPLLPFEALVRRLPPQ